MFKKIVYGILAFILGFMIYYTSMQMFTYDTYYKNLQECIETEDFEYILKMNDYHYAEPVIHESSDNLTISAYAVYSEHLKFPADGIVNKVTEADNVKGYVFFIYKPKDVAFEPTSGDNQFQITLTSGDKVFNYPNELKLLDPNEDTSINFKSYFDKIGIYNLSIYQPTISRYLGTVTSDGTITSETQSIDSLKIIDANGKTIFENNKLKDLLTFDNLSSEDFKTKGVIGYTDKEMKKLGFTTEVIWKLLGVMFIYVAIAVGIAFGFFYRKKSHAYTVPEK